MVEAKPPVKPDLRALTGLRGIAAWLVVFYHIRTGMSGYLPDQLMAFIAKGYLAVDFFFLLSGFVIWLSYSDRFEKNGTGYSSTFYWRRIARIWPLHIFILVTTMVFVAILAVTGRTTQGYPLPELPLHILLLQNWGLTSELSWNHPAWSISTEMAAYLLFPLLAVHARWERFSSNALIIIVIGLALCLHLYFRGFGLSTLGEDIARTGLVRCLVQFIMGTIICVLWQRSRGDWRQAVIFLTAGIVLLFGFAFAGWPETLVITIGFSSLLLSMAIFAEAPHNPLTGRVIHYFGEISYATYLVHFMLFILFKIIFVSDPSNISLPLIGLYIAMTFALSGLLYHWVEKPGQKVMLAMVTNPAARLATK